MARKPPKAESPRSPRDRLSQDFLRDLAAGWAANGQAAGKAMREKSPERYVETAGKAIATAEEPSDELDLSNAKDMQEIGRKLLKAVGCENPSARQIKAAVKANDAFVDKLEKIAGIVKREPATYNGRSVAAHWPESSVEGPGE